MSDSVRTSHRLMSRGTRILLPQALMVALPRSLSRLLLSIALVSAALALALSVSVGIHAVETAQMHATNAHVTAAATPDSEPPCSGIWAPC